MVDLEDRNPREGREPPRPAVEARAENRHLAGPVADSDRDPVVDEAGTCDAGGASTGQPAIDNVTITDRNNGNRDSATTLRMDAASTVPARLSLRRRIEEPLHLVRALQAEQLRAEKGSS